MKEGDSKSNTTPLHPLEIEQEKNKFEMEESPPFDFPSKVKLCISKNNFSEIIERVRKEVLCFSPKKSYGKSSNLLCKVLLNEDNTVNRIVCFSYFFIKAS